MDATRQRGWAILAALAFALPSWGQGPPREPQPAKARVDLYGDSLPEGALVRLGTVRFRHPGAVHDVAFSADGKLLATSSTSNDGPNMVIIWDRASGRRLHAIPVSSQPLPPTCLRFSPDGKRLFGSHHGRDMTLYAWDVETGANARDVPRLPVGARTLGYSPDSREILLLHQEAVIVRWDVEKGQERGRYPKPGGYLSAAAQVGERLLVPQFNGQSVNLWDAAHAKQLWSVQTDRDKGYPQLPMAFSPDGKLLVFEAPPRVMSVFDSVTGKMVRRLEGDAGNIYGWLSISPDTRTVAARNGDGFLRLWDLESGRERVKVATGLGVMTNATFASDSKNYATSGMHAIQLWETATGKRIDSFRGHSCPVSSISFSPDGRAAATCSRPGDPIVRLWDLQTGRLLRSLEASNGGSAAAVAFSPDGATLASCEWYGERKVRIWDARTGRVRHVLSGHEMGCTCLAFSPDGRRLASGDAFYNRMGHYEGRLYIWDTEAGKRIREIRGTPGAITRVVFTRDRRHLLAAAEGVHVYDADTGERIDEPFLAKARVWGLALSEDGRLLATVGQGPVRLWEMATRREIPLGDPGRNGRDVALSPDGYTVATANPNGGVVLFHWPTGATLWRLSGGAGTVPCLRFSPDGRRLATAANQECSTLVWDVSDLVNRRLPAVARPVEGDLGRWWDDLRADNPGEAYRAIWRFAAVPEQAVPFLANSLRPVPAPSPAAVARWIDDLDSSEFPVRETASRELEQLGEVVIDALRKVRKGDVSVEQSRRIDQLLVKLDGPVPGPEQVRAIQAVAALEQIGSPEARKVLVALAAGAAGARPTREAKAAAERLRRAGG